VHRQDYAEHEHLHAHSPGTYTTAGSSRDDETSEAATAHQWRGGSTGYNGSLASGTEGKRTEGCGIAASGGDWTRAQGLKLSPVPSFSWWSSMARSTETKQSEMASGEVGKWRMASPSSSGAEIRPASTDTRGLRSGGSVAVRWRAAAQLLHARIASVRAAVERCWTLTSGPSAILNFQ
jgi:hypothetical protein